MESEHQSKHRGGKELSSSSSIYDVLPKKKIKTLSGWVGVSDTKSFSVSIIGSAGRGIASAKMSKALFESMIKSAISVVENTWGIPWSQITLVSGGAAWADHVAVSLFMQKHSEGTKLELFLPCPLDVSKNPPRFEDNGVKDWKRNPGSSANRYHSKFSKALGHDTIAEIQEASSLGAILNTEHFGFKERNVQVAKSDYVLAFTWGQTQPEEGGTKHTWSLSKGLRLHIGLDSLNNLSSSTNVDASSRLVS